MKLTTLLEVQVPPTEYGYWIRDDGTIVPTTEMQHGSYAREYFPDTAEGPHFAALKAGWVRAIVGVYPHEEEEWRDQFHCYIELVPEAITPQAINSLKAIMAYAHKEATVADRTLNINIELKKPAGERSFAFGPNIETDKLGEALRFLSQHINV